MKPRVSSSDIHPYQDKGLQFQDVQVRGLDRIAEGFNGLKALNSEV
ncbi:MAG: hypothetical protein ABSE82_05005 [Nitrososphaerales archaeon]